MSSEKKGLVLIAMEITGTRKIRAARLTWLGHQSSVQAGSENEVSQKESKKAKHRFIPLTLGEQKLLLLARYVPVVSR